MSLLETTLEKIARSSKIELIREHRFHPIRRWRFDFADIDNKIAIEIEGGIWTRGRHTRGAGFRNDTIKYNQATILGWRILRYCNKKDIKENFIDDYLLLKSNG